MEILVKSYQEVFQLCTELLIISLFYKTFLNLSKILSVVFYCFIIDYTSSALSLFRFHLSPFPPETPYTQASGNLTEARGIEHYGLSGLNKSFFVCFFFLLLRYAGLIFLVLFAVVAFPLALSTQPIFKPVRRSPIIYCL